MGFKVVQIGDVAGVAGALTAALGDQAEVVSLPIAQAGARWPRRLKPLTILPRFVAAVQMVRRVRRLHPDVVHIHWLPNALVGLLLPRSIPWLIHVHGSDVRELNAWRRWLLRRAPVVLYSTPDLAPIMCSVRPDVVYLPTPIPPLHVEVEPVWDVLLASRASPEKGSAVAFAALRKLVAARPELRVAAIDGPAFEPGPVRLPLVPKAEFHRTLASARVVLGQFAIGALGIADLEALALDRPLVTWVRPELYPDAPPVLCARTVDNIVAATEVALDHGGGARGPAWVARNHGPEQVRLTLLGVYGGLES